MAKSRIRPSAPSSAQLERLSVVQPVPTRLVGRITTAEWIVGGLVAALMLVLVVIEPDILEAPVENSRTLLFTVGGTIVAAVALVGMLWLNVPAIVRILLLWVPFAIVSWWLISPFFLDDVVDEDFSTSIATQRDESEESTTRDSEATTPDAASRGSTGSDGSAGGAPAEEPVPQPSTVPALVGAGRFVGLAGHSGTGDAGIFRNPDGSHVLRFENFDIENGPDLEVYLVPGADQTSLVPGSIHLGHLKGNVGNQTYDLPSGTRIAPGPYTALVWCEAFSVEFVAATLTIN
jgi:Electron transfer DM13